MPSRKPPLPSDDMIVLAAKLGSEWQQAEEIASTLRLLGFTITPQKMVGTLRRLSETFDVGPDGELRRVDDDAAQEGGA